MCASSQAEDDIHAICCVVHLPTRTHWTLAVYVLEQKLLVHFDSLSEFQHVWQGRTGQRVDTRSYVDRSEWPAFQVMVSWCLMHPWQVRILILMLHRRVSWITWPLGQTGNAATAVRSGLPAWRLALTWHAAVTRTSCRQPQSPSQMRACITTELCCSSRMGMIVGCTRCGMHCYWHGTARSFFRTPKRWMCLRR